MAFNLNNNTKNELWVIVEDQYQFGVLKTKIVGACMNRNNAQKYVNANCRLEGPIPVFDGPYSPFPEPMIIDPAIPRPVPLSPGVPYPFPTLPSMVPEIPKIPPHPSFPKPQPHPDIYPPGMPNFYGQPVYPMGNPLGNLQGNPLNQQQQNPMVNYGTASPQMPYQPYPQQGYQGTQQGYQGYQQRR